MPAALWHSMEVLLPYFRAAKDENLPAVRFGDETGIRRKKCEELFVCEPAVVCWRFGLNRRGLLRFRSNGHRRQVSGFVPFGRSKEKAAGHQPGHRYDRARDQGDSADEPRSTELGPGPLFQLPAERVH